MMTISKTVALDRARRFPNKFGTLAQTRTERTLPFERSDFANLSTRAANALFGMRILKQTVITTILPRFTADVSVQFALI